MNYYYLIKTLFSLVQRFHSNQTEPDLEISNKKDLNYSAINHTYLVLWPV